MLHRPQTTQHLEKNHNAQRTHSRPTICAATHAHTPTHPQSHCLTLFTPLAHPLLPSPLYTPFSLLLTTLTTLATLNVLYRHGGDVLFGRSGWTSISVRDITFARPTNTTTQGRVVATDATSVTLQVRKQDEGFSM